MVDVRAVEDSAVSHRRTLIALVVPVGIYLMLAGIRVVRNPPPDFDERIFLDVARHIVDTGLPIRTVASPGPTLFFDHTPLLVYAVAVATALGGPTQELVRLLTLVTGVLTVLVVFRIGQEVRSVGSAFVAATLVAANPFFARYGWYVRMEVPMCLFMVVGLYLLLHRRYLSSGLAIAVAVMLKEVALAFWFVAGVYAMVRGGWRSGLRVVVPSVIASGRLDAHRRGVGHRPRVIGGGRCRCGLRGRLEAPDPADRVRSDGLHRHRARGVVRDQVERAALHHRRRADDGDRHRARGRLG